MIHYIYELAGYCFAIFMGYFYSIRDCISPPKEEAVLFIAHPDDDVLFFHTFIKEHKPYVVLITAGGILRRVQPFYRAMNHYGVRYRTFSFRPRAIDKEQLISEKINKFLHSNEFKICATHNAQGEYGHEMHKCVHRCVVNNWQGETILVPFDSDDIVNHPLSKAELSEKMLIMKRYYKKEYSVLKTFNTWIECEALRGYKGKSVVK